jgi:hypothetical protein
MDHETCPGCGLLLERVDGPKHPYLGASASCWALYGEVLAREYSDPALLGCHQLTVDAYSVQHPSKPDRRMTQSVVLHLLTLCLFLERGADPRHGPALHKRLVGRGSWFWLDPPRPNGTLNVSHVRQAKSPEEHVDRVWTWAADVWQAWAAHHETIHLWLDEALAEGS